MLGSTVVHGAYSCCWARVHVVSVDSWSPQILNISDFWAYIAHLSYACKRFSLLIDSNSRNPGCWSAVHLSSWPRSSRNHRFPSEFCVDDVNDIIESLRRACARCKHCWALICPPGPMRGMPTPTRLHHRNDRRVGDGTIRCLMIS